MGATYGLGIARHAIALDTPREDAIGLLRAIASYAGAPVRDVLEDDEVVEVSPAGAETALDGDRAEAVRAAVSDHGGSAGYAAFAYLDGFDVLVPDATRTGEIEATAGDDELELAVAPVSALRARLDELLAQTDIPPACHALHQRLRALCDDAERLGLPLVLSS
jgi:hypothetical protein